MQPIKLYTIYTEATNNEAVCAILGKYFDSFTVIPATGVWKAHEEQPAVIHIITFDRAAVYLATHEIKLRNSQDSVLVTELAITHNLV